MIFGLDYEKPAYTYVKNKGVDQARLIRSFFVYTTNSMAYISIKLLDCVNSQAGLFHLAKVRCFRDKAHFNRDEAHFNRSFV